jgi:hypothetical protein
MFSSLIAVTDTRVLANYMMWRAAAASMGYMTEAADKVRPAPGSKAYSRLFTLQV